MAGYEQTLIIGNVGRDPETRQAGSETVTSFTVAVSRQWRDRNTNEQKEATNWYNVSLWGARWEGVIPYIQKGKQLMVAGTVTARPYTGNDGVAKASLDLRADTVQLLGNRGSGDTGALGGDQPYNSGFMNERTAPQKQSSDDIPF